jgi:hypothetical protein
MEKVAWVKFDEDIDGEDFLRNIAELINESPYKTENRYEVYDVCRTVSCTCFVRKLIVVTLKKKILKKLILTNIGRVNSETT